MGTAPSLPRGERGDDEFDRVGNRQCDHRTLGHRRRLQCACPPVGRAFQAGPGQCGLGTVLGDDDERGPVRVGRGAHGELRVGTVAATRASLGCRSRASSSVRAALTSSGTIGGRAEGPRVTALSRISGRSTDVATVSSHATVSATSSTVMACISNGTSCSISVSTGPGRDDVDVDAVAVDLQGQRPGERVHACLRRRVRGAARHRLVGGRRGDEHEAGARRHLRQGGVSHHKTGIEVGGHGGSPLLEGLFARVGAAEHPGGVDEQVDPGRGPPAPRANPAGPRHRPPPTGRRSPRRPREAEPRDAR